MYTANVGGHFVTACGCCDLLMSNKISCWECSDQLEAHLEKTPKCKEWYDNLPTFADIRGIMKPGSEGDDG